MPPSLRKLLMTLALVGAVALGGRLFGLFGSGPVPVEIHYLLGPSPASVVSLEVLATPAGSPSDTAARFETRLIGPDVVQKTRLPGGDVRLDITLVDAAGARRTVARTIAAERNAKVRLDLSRDLPGGGG